MVGLGTALAAPSSGANLDQIRNGSAGAPISPGQWANGNAGSANAHYVEGYSVPYRVVMTNLPIGQEVTISIRYDTQLDGGKHAIDYMTHYYRLEPHATIFGHGPEGIDPTDGVSGPLSAPVTAAIPPPSSLGSPVPDYPTSSFNLLPADEKVMTLYNGTFGNNGLLFV